MRNLLILTLVITLHRVTHIQSVWISFEALVCQRELLFKASTYYYVEFNFLQRHFALCLLF